VVSVSWIHHRDAEIAEEPSSKDSIGLGFEFNSKPIFSASSASRR